MLLRVLHADGLRVDEIACLALRDLVARDDAGQVTAYGKSCETHRPIWGRPVQTGQTGEYMRFDSEHARPAV